MRLVIFIIVAVVAFVSPPFIFYFFIHDSGWEMVLRISAFFYFLGLGLLIKRYKKAVGLWTCILYAFLSIVCLLSFPFVFAFIYHSNLNLNNSNAIGTWSALCNVSFLMLQVIATFYFTKRLRTAYSEQKLA